MSDLVPVYLPILPDTSQIAPGVKKAMGGVESVGDKSGQTMGNRMSAGMQKTLKRTAIGVGVAAGAAIGTGLTKGIGRLNGIEQAESKLRGLGHSATGVGDIMENALASVRGTSFGLEQAATVAASAVAAGIAPGQELERTLTLVGDAASIAGVGMDEMGAIFNKVAASNKMQMDVVNQLHDAGVPALQLVADEMGVTAEEAQKMASAGKVSFEIFQNAMEAGMGGAALEAGNTVQGAFANMGAAAGRLGATIAGPFFRQAASGFGGVTEALDAMNDRVGPVMADVEKWLTGTAVPAFNEFREAGQRSWEAFSNSADAQRILSETVAMLQQMGQLAVGVGSSMGRLAAEVVRASAALGVSTWDVFVMLLNSTATILNATLVPALEAVASLAENNQGAVTAMVAAWMAFKTVPALMAPVHAGLDKVKTAAAASGAVLQQRWFGALRQGAPVVTEMQNAMLGARTQIGALGAAARVGVTNIGAFGGVVRTGATAALNGMRTAASNAMGVLGGPWGLAMIAAGAVVSGMVESNRRYEAALNATSDMQLAVAGSASTMFEALLDGASTLDAAEQATEKMQSSMQDLANNAPNWWGRVNMAIGEFGDSIGHSLVSTENMDIAYRDMADSAAEASDVLRELGYDTRDIAAAAVGSEAAYRKMRAELMESGRGGEYLADQMQKMRQGFQEAEAAAERLGPAGMIAADALRDVAEQAGTAEDRAKKLYFAFMELSGIEMTAAEASGELSRVIDQVSGSMDQVEGATRLANGAFDTTTSAGANAHDSMVDLALGIRRAVEAGEPLESVMGRSEGALLQMAGATDTADEKYQSLLEAYRLTPENIHTDISANSDPALATVEQIRTKFNDFVGEPMTKSITVHDEQFLERLTAMGFEWDNFDENTGTVDLTIEDQEAMDILNRWVQMELPKIDEANPTAHAVLEADGLFATNDFALTQLMFLDDQTPNPLATMDISRLSTEQQKALQDVGLLDGQKPTPEAFLNISQLDAEQQAALAKTFDLDSDRPTPIADLTKEQLDAKANAALRKLEDVDQEKPFPYIDANHRSAMDKLGGVKGLLDSLKDKTISVWVNRFNRTEERAAGGRFATGGRPMRLPAHADGDRHGGYRLPTAGPGTSVTDGFMAWDQYGMPAARLDAGEWIINGQSSEQYNALLKGINNDSPRARAALAAYRSLPGFNTGGRAGGDEPDPWDGDGAFDDILSGTSIPSAQDYLRFARGEMVNGFQMERSLQGAPYENFPGRDAAWGDCSYAMGRLAAFGLGMNPLGGRQFSTVTMGQWLRQHGATMGRGPEGSFRMGWYDNGGGQFGHTSGELPGGTNVEMGGSAGGGKIGAGAAGWDSPSYKHFAWIPAGDGSGSVSSAGGSSGDSSGYGAGYDPDSVELSREGQRAAETVTEAQNDPNSIFYGTGANTWGDLVGNIWGAALAGQINAALGVFDIPTSLPPLVQAGQTWRAQREEGQSDAEVEQSVIDAAAAVDAGDAAALEAEPAEVPLDVEVLPDWGESFFVREITRAAQEAGLDREAAVIGTGTSIVEVGSPLKMYANNRVPESLNFRHDALGSDHDSVGLFQQRDNGAWGTVAQRMNAFDSAGLFFRELVKFDWQAMGRGAAAQKVQRSAHPGRYEPVMGDAEALVDEHGVFDQGGRARGKGLLHKDVIDPERVLSPDQTRAFEDLVFNQLPDLSGLASSITTGGINAAAGGAAMAANTMVPGSGALISGVAAPAAEIAGMYAGQVTTGLQTTVTEFGRDMLSIPRSMADSVMDAFNVPQIDDRMIPQLSTLAPEAEAPEPAMLGAAGGVTNNFNGYDEDWAWSKYRRLEADQFGGRMGARG